MFRRPLYLCTIFISSLLLFLIQPMMGKALLPLYGGSAGVWTTVMLFFQVTLLLGYAYAHGMVRYLNRPLQIGLHLLLLGGSVLAVGSIELTRKPPGGVSPVGQILVTMTVTIGLPDLLLSSTGPLVQAWWPRIGKSSSPYRLFALSNIASLAALLLYPVLIEPHVTTGRQLSLWSIAFAIFALLSAVSILTSGGAKAVERAAPAPIEWREILLWVALAACPAALWMGMAHVLSQNVAPVPLLWVLPLAVYLLSFILCFDGEGWYRPRFYRIALPVSWIVMGGGLVRQNAPIGLKWLIAAALAALFVCGMFCHGELAYRKPHPSRLTLFYLMVALGGAIGGLFVATIAPAIFDQLLEFPIAVAACAILAMALLYGLPGRRVLRLAIVGAAAFVVAARINDSADGTLLRRRNFYGSLQVSETGSGEDRLRILSSGTIRHGSQFLAPGRGRVPTCYYGELSGVAAAIRSFEGRPVHIGVIGLGAGTLATYARPGDRYRFYELNPEVIAIAKSQFRYLAECQGKADIVEGDGRLALMREAIPSFDLIVLDAFSSDSIPVHLLTREAFQIYFDHLNHKGILAVHITNRYLDLEPVVRGLAGDAGRKAQVIRSPGEPARGTYEAVWVLITPGIGKTPQAGQVWADEFSNLFEVLR